MSNIYEIYYEDKNMDVVFCSDHITDETEAREEVRKLGVEFPNHEYWFEVTYEDEQ
jgi:hypothetical protein